jgi:adenylate cyclase class IV
MEEVNMMNYENEITVEVNGSLEELITILENKGFKLKETYDLNDIYLINKNDKEDNYLSMLNKCVLIRHIIEENKETKMLTYKYKEYNENEEITKQGKIKVKIDDIDNSILLFKKLNFEELIRIKDHMLVYATDKDELVIQNVNDKHIYIEIEDECHYVNKLYNSIEEMKKVIIDNSIPIKNNNFFVKKAEIELQETYGKGGNTHE